MPDGNPHWEIIITLGLPVPPILPEKAGWWGGNFHVESDVVMSLRVSLMSWVEALGVFLRVWVVIGVNSIDLWNNHPQCTIHIALDHLPVYKREGHGQVPTHLVWEMRGGFPPWVSPCQSLGLRMCLGMGVQTLDNLSLDLSWNAGRGCYKRCPFPCQTYHPCSG